MLWLALSIFSRAAKGGGCSKGQRLTAVHLPQEVRQHLLPYGS